MVFINLTAVALDAIAFLKRELLEMGVGVNDAKTVGLPPGHVSNAEELALVADEVGVAQGEGRGCNCGDPYWDG